MLYFPGLWAIEESKYGYVILHNGRDVGGAQDLDKAIDMVMMKLSPAEHAEYWREAWKEMKATQSV